MMRGQPGNRQTVAGEDRQDAATHAVDSGVETIERKVKPAKALFDGDLPRRHCADKYLVSGRQDGFPDTGVQPRWLRRCPNENVRVQQQVQGSRPAKP
jgi:hypothetical protein